MRAYLFPGQGSQAKGMGESLFTEFPAETKIVDEILGYSIKSLCLKNPQRNLSKTQFTQPALYVVNALSYQMEQRHQEVEPDFLAGHSLGEYNALQASGAISFTDGLKLVRKRGELMATAPKGTMAAILSLSEVEIAKTLVDNGLDAIDIANYNSPNQLVISGLEVDIDAAIAAFGKLNIKAIRLNTGGAFHSRYMKATQQEFGKYLNGFSFSPPRIPVISNVYAQPYPDNRISEILQKQLTNSVKWSETIQYILSRGDIEFTELGPGKVLTGMLDDITKVSSPQILPPDKIIPTVSAQRKKEVTSVAKQLVDDWNRKYPPGTKVTVKGYQEPLETRTKATVLFGRRPAVYMKNYSGYFSLTEMSPQSPS